MWQGKGNAGAPIIDLSSMPVAPEPILRRPLRTLLLADTPRRWRSRNFPGVILDHVEGLKQHTKNKIRMLNCREPSKVRCPDLSPFDAVIIHYSIHPTLRSCFPPDFSEGIMNFRGVKVVMIQDECRWIDEVNEKIAELGIDLIVSSLSPANIPKVYNKPAVHSMLTCSALPGYLPERLLRVASLPISQRPRHVVYRSREIPYWMGAFCREKRDIAVGFRAATRHHTDLVLDLETTESSRIYGRAWIDFLRSARATLATEGGASIFDFDGRVEQLVQAYLAEHQDAGFDEVARDVLGPYEGNVVHKTITPRCFEAIALRTALVMFPGEYRGVLKPWRHYIPLAKDFSNIEEVVTLLRDAAYLQDMVDRTFEEIAAVPDYRMSTFVRRLDALIDDAYVRSVPRRLGGHQQSRSLAGRIVSRIRRTMVPRGA